MSKHPIRQDCLQARRRLAAATHARLSLQVQQNVLSLPEWTAASAIALYSPIHNEVATGELLQQAFSAGKRVFFPRVDECRLQFVPLLPAQVMAPGAFGIPEPSGEEVPPREIDLMFVPGVAFDLSGHRLGYGKGFYDQALAEAGDATLLTGLAFELQLVPELPAEEHDVRMNLLITETEIRRLKVPEGEKIKPNVSLQGGLF